MEDGSKTYVGNSGDLHPSHNPVLHQIPEPARAAPLSDRSVPAVELRVISEEVRWTSVERGDE